MKKFMQEFREFIARGDVMSMAVGIIIGGAFTAIVNSLVADIITPLLAIPLGTVNFSDIVIYAGHTQINIGNFIQAVITFLLTALVIFSMMKAFNTFLKKKEEAAPEPEVPAEPPVDIQLLTEIRDLLKK